LLNPIYAEIIDGVQAEVRGHGYHTMLVTGNEDSVVERGEIEKLLEFQVEGLMLIGHRMPSGALDAIAGDCPAVIISRAERGIAGLDSISNDDVAGARLAVDHLVSLGHRAIAHVTGGSNEVSLLRRSGYERAMAEHRLAKQVACYDGAFTDEGGYRGAAAALDSAAGHTALFVANDLAAVGALAAAAERGVAVPGDVSIVGYDGMALAGLRSLSITTIAQPLAQIGTEGATLLFQRINDPARPPAYIGVEPRLIVRNSTGPLTA
jgi:DNA-binding LacI/PurR family transcriptional regulator